MGEHDDRIAYFSTDGEKWTELKEIPSVEIHDPLDYSEYDMLDYYVKLSQKSESAKKSLPRKVSRKRFVKLLMGRGFSRNTANKTARLFKGWYKDIVYNIMFLQ